MTRAYWNRIAENYEVEVFDVLKYDQAELVLNQIRKYGSQIHRASDLGCGIGRFLPSLSSRFQKVIAVDILPKFIAKAQTEHSRLSNVSYLTMDLSEPCARLPKVDFALSVNTLITPSLARRNSMFDVIANHLRIGSHLVLVVPALESALLTDFRLIEWNLRDGMKPSVAVGAGFRAYRQIDAHRLHEGIVLIDNVPTKHYLKEELIAVLDKRGIKTLDIHKIEYSWKTEFASPPRWMKTPYPWDWLFVAQKVKIKR